MISTHLFLALLTIVAGSAASGSPAWTYSQIVEREYTPAPITAFLNKGKIFAFTERNLTILSTETGKLTLSREVAASSVRRDAQGMFYLFKCPPSAKGSICSVTKLNSVGDEVWARSGIAGQRFQVTANGEVMFASVPKGEGAEGTFEVKKLGVMGEFLWTHRYSLPKGYRTVFYADTDQTAVDREGNFVLSTALYKIGSSSLERRSYFAKISPSGKLLWNKILDLENPQASAEWLKVDEAGHYYVRFTNSGLPWESYVARFTPEGVLEWRYKLHPHLTYGHFFVNAKRGGLIIVDDGFRWRTPNNQTVEFTALKATGEVDWQLTLAAGFEVPVLAFDANSNILFASGSRHGGSPVNTRYWGKIHFDGKLEFLEEVIRPSGVEQVSIESIVISAEGVFVFGSARFSGDPSQWVQSRRSKLIKQRRILIQAFR